MGMAEWIPNSLAPVPPENRQDQVSGLWRGEGFLDSVHKLFLCFARIKIRKVASFFRWCFYIHSEQAFPGAKVP
jgi:hypothetical protein